MDNVILNHYGYLSISEEAKKNVLNVFRCLLDKNGGILDYFTTNYDVGLESIWSSISKDVSIVTGLTNPLDISGDWNGALLDITKPDRHGLYVHRLHGCVRWFRYFLPSDSDTKYKIVGNPKLMYNRESEPCVMYPGRKFNTSQPPFADSFIRFRRALSETACVIIVGSSFRDNNLVEYLLEANDKRNAPLPILIIDISDVKPRFFQKIREVRNGTHFHYKRTAWKVKFLVGDYTNKFINKKMLDILDNLDSINLIDENQIEMLS